MFPILFFPVGNYCICNVTVRKYDPEYYVLYLQYRRIFRNADFRNIAPLS